MKASSHKISIPAILEVGSGTLENVGELLKKYEFSKIVLFFGEGIDKLFGDIIATSLNKFGIHILDTHVIDNVDFENIADFAFSISGECEAIVGVGGGKVLDCAKYMSFLKKLPFISIPTSTSNDGFSSPVSSVIVNGKRTSVPAKIPYGIIIDTNTIKSAPDKFIYSGIGDLLSNITALYDWKFEEQNGKTIVDDFALMISKKSVNSFVRTEFNTIRDDLFIKELVDSLAMNGISMEIAGSSAPASGSEHLISHAFDKISTHPELHGIQVGIATYIMSKVQNHRFERITKIFTQTGFFDYVKTLNMKASEFAAAIDLAPSIKPQRYTFIHIEKNRDLAKQILFEDPLLKNILS